MKFFRITIFAFLMLPAAVYAKGPQQSAARAAVPVTGFRAEFFANLEEVQEKIMDLAESTPPERFTWRPESDVRSVSEVYMHIAGGNYFLATFLGVPAPNRASDLETKVTKKAEVVAELKR